MRISRYLGTKHGKSTSETRRTCDAEFKRNAVLMVEESVRTATEVAENLGIAVDLIYRWRREIQ